jgi:alpha-ketoglutarate-dependent taurine dioxygenase
MEIRELRAPFGAEVVGLGPELAIGARELAKIREALHRHRLLVFRGEPRSSEALASFARRFGDLIELYDHATTVPGHPEIVRVSNVEEDGRPIGLAGAQELPWHHDHSYLPRPARESFLEASLLPPAPPRTEFVDMAAGLEALPKPLRDRIRGLRAVHHIDERGGGSDPAMGRSGTARVTPDYVDETNVLAQARIASKRAVHPVVARHPESGVSALYVSPLATHEVVDLSPGESASLLGELFERAILSERIHSHAWETGDLVVWDTLSTLHRRDAFDPSGRRSMRQMSTQCRHELEAAP